MKATGPEARAHTDLDHATETETASPENALVETRGMQTEETGAGKNAEMKEEKT